LFMCAVLFAYVAVWLAYALLSRIFVLGGESIGP